jgi:hypothetical protein
MTAQWSGGEVVLIGKESNKVTSEQWDKLEILQERHGLSDPVEVLPGLGYIGVMVGSMFIGIEPDGYSHT